MLADSRQHDQRSTSGRWATRCAPRTRGWPRVPSWSTGAFGWTEPSSRSSIGSWKDVAFGPSPEPI